MLAPTAHLANGARLEALSLPGPRGRLAVTLHRPASPNGTAVLFAHGWSGNRTGPQGLLQQMAAALTRQGFTCLRFDFSGRGESEGSGLDASLTTMADDLVCAAIFLADQPGISSLSLVGMCSGGNVAIGALPRLPDMAGMVLLSVYPFSDGDAFGRDMGRTWHHLGIYLRKACRLETWRRFRRGELYVDQIATVLFGHFRKRQRTTASAPGQSSQAAAREGRHAKAPPKTHLANLRAEIPALMLYGGADPDAKAAKTYFGEHAREHALPIHVNELQAANHNFSSEAWTRQVVEQAAAFLKHPA